MAQHGILLKAGTNEMEILAVTINEGVYGINVAKVQHIQQYNSKLVTSMPGAPPSIIGMLLHRDHTVPLIDLAEMLNLNQPESLRDAIVVVTEFNKSINGFLVHGVQRIHRLSWDKFVPLHTFFGSAAFVNGTVNVDGQEILVLDLEHILALLFPNLALEDIQPEALQKKDVDRSRLNIIFAEDSTTIRKGMVAALRKSGFKSITEFANGLDAFDYLNDEIRSQLKHNQSFALISDIEMPGMDGLTLCRKVKTDAELSNIKVVMFSSLINEQMIDKCKNVGAERCVTKPEANALIGYLDEFSMLA